MGGRTGLFLTLAQRWNVGADELCAGAGGAANLRGQVNRVRVPGSSTVRVVKTTGGKWRRLWVRRGQEKTKGRRRHIVTDSQRIMGRIGWWHSAGSSRIANGGGADATIDPPASNPFLRHSLQTVDHADDKLRPALTGNGDWNHRGCQALDDQKGFKVLPRRGLSNATFAWLGRSRRLAKGLGETIQSSTAWDPTFAHIRILMRRFARHCENEEL